jgi:hypothetical protein
VAFSDNGSAMVIGKQGSTGGLDSGATLYYDSNGQYFSTTMDLTVENLDTDGMSVALSGDGKWAFVGAVGVLSYNFITENLCKGLVLPTPNNSPFSLATNSDGSTLIIGTGANVLVYTAFSYQTASITQTILPQLGETTSFGLSVSLTRDGSILAIGSCGFGVYIYQMTNLTTPSQIITSPDASTNFGCNVDISDDGRKLIVGSQNAATPAVSNGYAYPFRSNGGFFSLENSNIAPPVFNVSYGGGGVAVVNEALDYAIVLVGGPTANNGPTGAISVFDSVPTSSATATATASATSSSSASASRSASYSAVPSASATATNSATSTMTSTSSATTTSTTSPSSTATPSSSSQPINSLASNSALIGVTAGVAISGSLVGTVLGYFVIQWLRRRFLSSQQQSPSNEFSSLSTSVSSQKSTLLYSSSSQGGSNMYSS